MATINRVAMATFLVVATSATLSAAQQTRQVGGFCMIRPHLGWHFYCDPEQQEPAPTPEAAAAEPVVTPPQPIKPQTARQEIEDIRAQLDEARAEAVLRPTPKNVANYIMIQRQQLDRAGNFADQWRRVLWQTPELDYTLSRPVTTMGKATWLDNRREQEQQTVQKLNDRYGIFYFYSSTCMYCKVFSPVLKQFADQHELAVIPVTRDGISLPDWPNSQIDSGQAMRLGIFDKPVPAVLLFDNQTNQVIPVAFEALSHDELSRRIYVQTQLDLGDDF